MSRFVKRKGFGVLNGQRINTDAPKFDLVDLTQDQADIYIDYLEMRCLMMQGFDVDLDLMKMKEKEVLSWRRNKNNWVGDKLA